MSVWLQAKPRAKSMGVWSTKVHTPPNGGRHQGQVDWVWILVIGEAENKGIEEGSADHLLDPSRRLQLNQEGHIEVCTLSSLALPRK
jgi:hypothetical protein